MLYDETIIMTFTIERGRIRIELPEPRNNLLRAAAVNWTTPCRLLVDDMSRALGVVHPDYAFIELYDAMVPSYGFVGFIDSRQTAFPLRSLVDVVEAQLLEHLSDVFLVAADGLDERGDDGGEARRLAAGALAGFMHNSMTSTGRCFHWRSRDDHCDLISELDWGAYKVAESLQTVGHDNLAEAIMETRRHMLTHWGFNIDGSTDQSYWSPCHPGWTPIVTRPNSL